MRGYHPTPKQNAEHDAKTIKPKYIESHLVEQSSDEEMAKVERECIVKHQFRYQREA